MFIDHLFAWRVCAWEPEQNDSVRSSQTRHISTLAFPGLSIPAGHAGRGINKRGSHPSEEVSELTKSFDGGLRCDSQLVGGRLGAIEPEGGKTERGGAR